jgi:hypothetical protein
VFMVISIAKVAEISLNFYLPASHYMTFFRNFQS